MGEAITADDELSGRLLKSRLKHTYSHVAIIKCRQENRGDHKLLSSERETGHVSVIETELYS